MKIAICLPPNRECAGSLTVSGPAGDVLLGPVAVAGRAHAALAKLRGNPVRDPRQPYGDTPCGTYRVRINRESAAVIILEPRGGEAALADANGRFFTCFAGDPQEKPGSLRATAGALRMFNADLAQLRALLEAHDGEIECEICDGDATGIPVFDDWSLPTDEDPPRIEVVAVKRLDVMTRRAALAATAAMGLATATFFSPRARANQTPVLVTQYTPEPTAEPSAEATETCNASVTLHVTQNDGASYTLTVYNGAQSETCSGPPGAGCSVEVACGDGYQYTVRRNGAIVKQEGLGAINGPRDVYYP